MKTILSFLLFLSSSIALAQGKVKRIVVEGDQIIPVQTAVGIATIIQLPDRPNSVVIGDQDSFKVEYLDKAITIKPLHSQAKSNLYLYTDWKRYNVQLISGAQAAADYVVYLEPKKDAPKIGASNVNWRIFRNKLRSESISLETKRVGKTRDGVILLEFSVYSNVENIFNPEWIWVTQGQKVRPIQQLFLSKTRVSGDSPIQGVIQLLARDLELSQPIRIELRRKRMAYLTLPKAVVWK
jgi:hypothetical protein